jgi:hypothetical protein
VIQLPELLAAWMDQPSARVKRFFPVLLLRRVIQVAVAAIHRLERRTNHRSLNLVTQPAQIHTSMVLERNAVPLTCLPGHL